VTTGQHSLPTLKVGVFRTSFLGFEAETPLPSGFRAHIRSQHIKTQQVASSAARNRRRSDTEALFTLRYDVYNTIWNQSRGL